MHIFILLTGLIINHYAKSITSIRRYEWIQKIHIGVLPITRTLPPIARALLPILVSLFFIYILNTAIHNVLGRFFESLFALLVFLYCLGPRDIDTDVNRIVNAVNDDAIATDAAPLLTTQLANNQLKRNEQLIKAVFQAGLQRWFAIIFWFALCGIYGALAYRACSYLASTADDTESDSNIVFRKLLQIRRLMEWPVAQLMTLAIALAADFDAVYKAWQQYHKEKGSGLKTGDYGFMLLSACLAIQGSSPAGVGVSNSLSGHSGTASIARGLLQRVLLVWLTVLIIILLASWLL